MRDLSRCNSANQFVVAILLKIAASPMRMLISLVLLLGMASVLTATEGLAQEISTDEQEPLLQVEGVLEEGDEVLEDGSLYDVYTFEGEAGQVVSVTLESLEFDTYLLLVDPEGQKIAENDDFEENTHNSAIVVTLPQTGIYTAVANAYDEQGYGIYQLTANLISSEAAQSQFSNTAQQQEEANRLLDQGYQQYQISQFQEATEIWQRALVLYQEIGDRVGESQTLMNLANAQLGLDRYQNAIAFYEQRIAIAREIGDRAGEGDTLGNLGIVYRNLGQFQRAISLFQQHLAIAREIGNKVSEASALGNLGNAYRSMGQFQQAIDFYEQTLFIMREIKNLAGEGAALGNLGIAYGNLGEFQQAVSFLEQYLAVTQQAGDKAGEGAALGNLGIVYSNLGQYRRAIDLYEQQLAIAHEVSALDSQGRALGNLGDIYLSLGQYQQAIEFFHQSLIVARETGNLVGEGAALGSLGIVYDELGQHRQAIDLYEQVLVIAQEINDRVSEGSTLGNLGVTYHNLNQHQQAINFHQQHLTIARELGDRSGEGNALGNLGIVHNDLEKYEQAIDFYEQRLSIAREIGDLEGEANALNNQGLTFINSGQFLLAEKVLRESIEVYESLRINLSDDQLISIADTQARAYANLERALTAQDKTVDALEITERARARALVLQLARRIATPEEQAALATSSIAQAPTIEEIQQIARETNTTLVTYSLVSDETLHIWVIQPTGDITFRQVDLSTFPDDALLTFVQQTRESMGVRSRADVAITTAQQRPQISRAEQTQNLKQLHQLLIAPIAGLLPTDPNERVVFIPHQSLFLVPFAALMDADDTYLIEKHTILTAPSIQVLGLTQELQTTNGNGRRPLSNLSTDELLIVGNPTMPRVWNPEGDTQTTLSNLPGAEAEAVQVAEFLGTKALTGAAATEPAVRQQMASARLIHLATHGLLEYGLPEESGVRDFPGAIALAPDATVDNSGLAAPGDGLLTAAELLEMDLNAELVVLSACNTGRGRITGDGVVGLSRSLITAGVPSVIVSLWSVPDAPTADLMTTFYEQLQQNPDKAQALRQAMLITMEQHEDPIDWAAFTLIGAAQ